MGKIAIKFLGVTKKFPKAEKYSVCETNLSIEEGIFVTILGTSGSGKTTLLKMVNRIHEQTSGQIFVEGEDISKLEATSLRRKIGYVIQQIGLFPHMTVEDNIATVPKILGWDEGKISERIDFLLELVHLPPKDYRKRYPRQLSGGQQQRVGLARAMAGNPKIMLMDEPFGAIDAITRSNLQDELLGIQRRLHKTILFVTHDVNEALKLGDKVVIMHEGCIQQYDTPLNIILKPANEFVAKLVSSEDVIQKLGFIKAETVMKPLKGDEDSCLIKVKTEESLKNVLTHFLSRNTEYILVEDSDGKIVGKIGLANLRIINEQKCAGSNF